LGLIGGSLGPAASSALSKRVIEEEKQNPSPVAVIQARASLAHRRPLVGVAGTADHECVSVGGERGAVAEVGVGWARVGS
jgi:hypothetical protein